VLCIVPRFEPYDMCFNVFNVFIVGITINACNEAIAQT